MYTVALPGCAKENYSNLGSLYSAVAETLQNRKDWTLKITKKTTGRFHLLLGEAQASTIPYKVLSGYDSLYPGLCPMVNFYRGFNVLCRKTMMVKTLRHYLDSHPGLPTFQSICPQSFLFFPSRADESERELFISANQSQADSVWILKPSDGCKGHSILIMDNVDSVLQFLDGQQEGTIAWVVQTYLQRPVLIPLGRRKFDIRVWVLLDEEYSIYVYGQGALRVTAKTYKNGDWNDLHCHLSNHCIAETHPDYGQYEATNEIWYDDFEHMLLDVTGGRISFHQDIIPKIHDIVVLSLLAVKDNMMASSCSAYRPFNVFGYDFMLTEADTVAALALDHSTNDYSASSLTHSMPKESGCNRDDTDAGYNSSNLSRYTITGDVEVKLLEINSSPAVATQLLPNFVKNLVELVIDRNFPPEPDYTEESQVGKLNSNDADRQTADVDSSANRDSVSCTTEGSLFPEKFIKVYDGTSGVATSIATASSEPCTL